MNRLRVFALAGLGLLGLSLGSAQAGERHWHYCRPVCPAPVVTCTPASCPVVACPPVTNYSPGFRVSYYNRFGCGPRFHSWRRCR